jgi:DNA polymerase-4
VSLKLRDSNFKTVTRSHTLNEAACEDHVIFDTVVGLFRKLFTRRTRVRLIGVALSSRTVGASPQMELFEDLDARQWQKLYQGIDRIRDKYGFRSILRGSSFLN